MPEKWSKAQRKNHRRVFVERAPRRKSLDVDLAPYVGRWVAIVYGRVTGVGANAVEAQLASKNQRPKEEPLVILVHPENQNK